MGERTSYEPGTICQVGLATPDPVAATAFYTSLFSWQAEDMSAGESGVFTAMRHDGKHVAILYRQNAASSGRASSAPLDVLHLRR